MKTYKMKIEKGTVRKDGAISSLLHSHFFHFSFLISHLGEALYTTPCANMALATFIKPATLAPLT